MSYIKWTLLYVSLKSESLIVRHYFWYFPIATKIVVNIFVRLEAKEEMLNCKKKCIFKFY